MARKAFKRNGEGPGDDEAMRLRRLRVLDLRIAGGSVRAIATALGASKSQVSRDLQAVLAELQKEQNHKAEIWRTIALERHEANYLKLNAQLNAGHLGANDRALRILQEEAKLLGLYAPELIARTTADGDDLPTLETLMQRYEDAHRGEDSPVER
jgi:hypothetical protein